MIKDGAYIWKDSYDDWNYHIGCCRGGKILLWGTLCYDGLIDLFEILPQSEEGTDIKSAEPGELLPVKLTLMFKQENKL